MISFKLGLFWFPYLSLSDLLFLLGQFVHKLIWERGIFFVSLFRFENFLFSKGLLRLEELTTFLVKEEWIMGKIAGIRTDEVQEFVPKSEEKLPIEERTVFKYRFLSVNDSAQITDQVYSAKGFGNKREELLRAGTQEVTILRKGLVGWEKFNYEDGKEVVWEEPEGNKQKKESIMDKNLSKIPPEIRGEIADAIRGSSSLSLD